METGTDWPGNEIKNLDQRAICQHLVREQGWRYRKMKDHGMLYAPDGVGMHAVHGNDGAAAGFKHWCAEMRVLGADLDTTPVREKYVGESLTSDGSGSIADTRWRRRQARSGVWWRQAMAGEVCVECGGLDGKHQHACSTTLSDYAKDFLARAHAVRPDARGDKGWALSDARQMLKDGYPMERVIERTGWGSMWLADLAARLGA